MKKYKGKIYKKIEFCVVEYIEVEAENAEEAKQKIINEEVYGDWEYLYDTAKVVAIFKDSVEIEEVKQNDKWRNCENCCW